LALSPYRWKIITPSNFPWEQEALDYIRQNLPTSALFGWSGFEFISASGALYENDLLVLTSAGLYLIDIKSWPGTLKGDIYTWHLEKPDGRTRTFDNPLFLVN